MAELVPIIYYHIYNNMQDMPARVGTDVINFPNASQCQKLILFIIPFISHLSTTEE